MGDIAQDLPFGIYIHWPYCVHICPYCDFNVYKARQGSDIGEALLKAILSDLSYWRDLSGPRRLTSVHFGGGTPSLMSAEQISAVIETIDALWGLSQTGQTTQIALEANPSDADSALWTSYRGAGIGRLSLGVQSFDDKVLSRLGRFHDGAQARRALSSAMTIFDEVSADLIFGHAGQSLKDWQTDLSLALEHGPQHLSCYQLTIEDGTAFARAQNRGEQRAVGVDESADLYEATCAQLGAAGYRHYEISNFAKGEANKGEENGASNIDRDHRSAHNLIYWQGGDYVGVGPGAHGRLTTNGARLATVAHMKPADYIDAVSARGHGLYERAPLSRADHAAEYVMMGLRIDEGISLARYKGIAGAPLYMGAAQPLISAGLLYAPSPDRLAATPAGRPVLDSLTRHLLGG